MGQPYKIGKGEEGKKILDPVNGLAHEVYLQTLLAGYLKKTAIFCELPERINGDPQLQTDLNQCGVPCKKACGILANMSMSMWYWILPYLHLQMGVSVWFLGRSKPLLAGASITHAFDFEMESGSCASMQVDYIEKLKLQTRRIARALWHDI